MSSRFFCVFSVVERFSIELLWAILSYWAESHLESCKRFTMKYPLPSPPRKQPTASRHWLFPQKCFAADIKLDSKWPQPLRQTLQMWGVGRLQVHGLCNYSFAHKKVVEDSLSYKRHWLRCFRNPACGDSTGSNGTEKDRFRMPPGLFSL